MKSRVDNIAVTGVAAALPKTAVSLDDLCAQMKPEQAGELRKAAAMAGAENRRVAPPETTTSDLCFAAAETLLETLGWSPDSVGILVFISQTPDHLMPATSCLLQNRLKLPRSAAAFDINLGCSGYSHGLWIASQLLATSDADRCLLLVGDTVSKFVRLDDWSNRMLFGDAGSATALERRDGASPIRAIVGTDGEGAGHIMAANSAFRRNNQPPGFQMNGFEVAAFVRRTVPDLVRELASWSNLGVEEIDQLVLHQANAYMINNVARKLKLREGVVPVTLERYANTSSASIPVALIDRRTQLLNSSRRNVILSGFGAGLSWSAVLADLSQAVLPPFVEI